MPYKFVSHLKDCLFPANTMADFFYETVIHYLQNKVGVVDFAKSQGPEGPAGFETLPIHGIL